MVGIDYPTIAATDAHAHLKVVVFGVQWTWRGRGIDNPHCAVGEELYLPFERIAVVVLRGKCPDGKLYHERQVAEGLSIDMVDTVYGIAIATEARNLGIVILYSPKLITQWIVGSNILISNIRAYPKDAIHGNRILGVGGTAKRKCEAYVFQARCRSIARLIEQVGSVGDGYPFGSIHSSGVDIRT